MKIRGYYKQIVYCFKPRRVNMLCLLFKECYSSIEFCAEIYFISLVMYLNPSIILKETYHKFLFYVEINCRYYSKEIYTWYS